MKLQVLGRRAMSVAGVSAVVFTTAIAMDGTTASASASAVTCTNVGTALSINSTLNPGQCIKSTNGSFSLVMQTDGNLVSYRNSNAQVCWSSGTGGRSGTTATVHGQRDGAPIDLDVHGSWGSNEYLGSGSGTLNVSESNIGQMYVGYSASYDNC